MLTVVVAALVTVGLHRDGSVAGPGETARIVDSSSPTVQTPTVQTPAEPGSERRPVSIEIPAIKVNAGVTRLGLNADQTVQVPEDPDDTGWYDQGPAPGENGSAVILGHVDSERGPAVFSELKKLARGDRVAVSLTDGSVVHYRVLRVAHYANEDFPAEEVYAGSPDRPALNLVTCGGTYDAKAGGYQSNVVVYTKYLWATDR